MRTLNLAIAFALPSIISSATASVIYTDFTPRNTAAATTTDFYNQTVEGTNGQQFDTAGFPFSVTDATEIDGSTATTVHVTLSFYNNGSGQTRFFNSTNVFGTTPAGFEEYARDGYLVNNHNTNGNGAGNEFGFILTYSDLDPAKTYDVSVWGKRAGNVDTGTWSVTTGTGDADVLAMENGEETIMDWTSVTPNASGEIVFTNVTTPSGTFANTQIAFTSIAEAVPEPSSALLGFCSFGLLLRRRR